MTTPEDLLNAELAARYRIAHTIGSGGMATVFLADDLRHHRKVAIKVIRPELAAIVGVERFLTEIQVTANLQHPHILGLIDSGAVNGQLYYVMPLVEGESLRARLDRERQLPVEDAVSIATMVASALDYAHRRSVVHRDIKPENILLHDGQAVVADFGIALAVSHAAGERLTETGLSLGTPQYMSPEQAAGERSVDGRTDIWSLGCTTYEMLAGSPPFTGPNAQAILSALLTTEPDPVQFRRPAVPEHVAAAIHTALERIPADRFATAGEFAEALRRPTERTTRRIHTMRPRRSPVRLLPALAIGILLGLGAGLAGGRLTAGSEEPLDHPRHWNLLLPAAAPLALTGPGPLGFWQLAVALAPAGDRLVYVSPGGRTTHLVVRPLDADSALVLRGTDGAYHPFFSPDGRWIGYFAGNELRKIQVTGGAPITLATVDRPSGAAWPAEDRILLFQQDGFEMRWISASGGEVSSTLLSSQFGAPEVLPDGDWAVGHLGSGQLALVSLSGGEVLAVTRRGVMPVDSVQLGDLLDGASPKYMPTGHLVFASGDGVLMALPFDAGPRRVLGEPVPVATRVRIEEGFGFAQYALAPDGTLVFVPGRSQLYGQLATIRPDGTFDTLPLPRGQYTQPRMSPDGSRLAVQVRKPIGGWDVLIVDLRTGVPERVVVEGNYRAYPASWSPDGTQLLIGQFLPAHNVFLGAKLYTFARRAFQDVPAFDGSYLTIAPNGRDFVYSHFRTGDLFIRPLLDSAPATAIPARGWAASFSPDGRWLAWGGADGGVAVSPVPPTGAIHQVAGRGQQPLWSPDGRRLTFRDGRRFHEVTVETSSGFRSSRPRVLVEGPFIRTFAWNHTMGPDGRLIAMISTPGEDTRELRVITDFPEEVRRLAPHPDD